MKKLLLSIAVFAGIGGLKAQTPVGTVVNNFTLTDINGISHDLFSYLDAGKMVVIDVSATWCPPCWSYHETGALNNFYNAKGPNGTNEAMVFFIEGDVTTTTDELNGIGPDTQGDWVTGENMPIIDLTTTASFENSGLDIAYFPVMYVICPNRTVLQSGTAGSIGTLTALNSYIGDCPAVASDPVDPALLGYTGTTTSCSNFNLSVTLQNNGTTPLTSATISVTGIPSPITYNWTGNLNTYGVAQVNLGTVNLTNSATATITITSTDNNAANSTLTQQLSYIDPTVTTAVNSTEGFASASFPYANWQLLNADNDITWERLSTLGGMMGINTFNYTATGELDHFITQSFNLTGQSNPSLLFKVANRRYNATYFDKLDVSVSTNCNGPFTQVFTKQGTALATGTDLTSSFTPASASDFRQECVSLANYANASSLFVRFTNDNKYGNNIYIDDISISSSACTSGLEEMEQVSFEVYPNPATDVINIAFNAKTADYVVSLMDLQGRVVSTMNLNNASGSQTLTFGTENLAKGSYVVVVSSNGAKTTKHVVVK
jgi:thiol-disulfide isomerase/thioredoxin